MNMYDTKGSKDAFFRINKESEREKLAWLETKLQVLLSNQNQSLELQLENLRAYANSDSAFTIGEAIGGLSRRRSGLKRVRMAHIFDITELKVSQMTRLKSDILVTPRHAEYDDRAAAKVSHLVIKNINEQQSFDQKMIELHRFKYILGESYLMIEWDDYLGDYDPIYVEAKNQGIDKIVLPNGKPLDLKYPLMTGDVRYTVEYPWNVLPEQTRSGKYDQAQYMFHITFVDRCELEEDYPQAANKSGQPAYNTVIDSLMRIRYPELDTQTIVYHFYHKKTKYLPEGKYIKFIPGVLLEEMDLPYSHGGFPCERLTDIDIPTHQEGVSRYVHCLPIQKRIDELNYAVDKNNWMFGNTKYLLPVGSAKVEMLGNSNQVIHYAGPVPPSVMQVNPTPPQMYERIQSLVNTLQILMGTQGISRGEIPPGITANSALQFLNQLDSERSSSEIQKHADFVIRVCRKALSLAGDRYKTDDGRLLNVVGKDNSFYIKNFDSANLSKPYDIKFENSDGFPETQAARHQRIQDMMQQNPDMMSGAEWMHYFGLGDDEGVIDSVTEAIKTAESENEDLMAGNPISPPNEEADLLTKFKVRLSLFQKRAFVEEASNEAMLAAKQNLFDIETLMIAKMKTSPMFQAEVAKLTAFPVYFHPEYVVPQSAEHVGAVVQGEANRGEELTGVIPANEPKDTLK